MGTSLPIKSIKEINSIKALYKRKHKINECLLFVLAINTGLGLIDLLNLKVKDVKNKLYLSIDKNKTIPLNNEIIKLINRVVNDRKQNSYLFLNNNGKKLHRATVFCSFKNICDELGLCEKYSVASWRKTFAYHYYKKYKDLSYLQWLFNQHSINQTLKFITVDENMNLRYRGGVAL